MKTLLVDHIRTRVIPNICIGTGASDLMIDGLILSGSRASKQARVNSDVDAVALISGKFSQTFKAEYHGSLELTTVHPLPLEVRLFSHSGLIDEIESAHLYRIHAISSGLILEDRTGLIGSLQAKAQARIRSSVDQFDREIQDLDPETLLEQVRNIFGQSMGILTDAKYSGNSLAQLSRYMEYVLDFYILMEMHNLRNCYTPDALTSHHLELLLLAKGDRGARFLNSSRYPLPSWFSDLSTRLSAIFDDRSLSVSEKIRRGLTEMDFAFSKLTGSPLIRALEEAEPLLLICQSQVEGVFL